MKEISELNLPDDIRYTSEHEWARPAGDAVRVGVTDYAQEQLGDITFVELPQVGDAYNRGDQFGTLESTKAVGDLFMPLTGEVVAVNEALVESPELVNQDPYVAGWIADVKPENPGELEELMTNTEYREMLEGME
jgi:glycine cleavage system H protein